MAPECNALWGPFLERDDTSSLEQDGIPPLELFLEPCDIHGPGRCGISVLALFLALSWEPRGNADGEPAHIALFGDNHVCNTFCRIGFRRLFQKQSRKPHRTPVLIEKLPNFRFS